MSEMEPTIEIGGMRGPDDKFYPVEYVPDSQLNEDRPNYEIRAVRFQPRPEGHTLEGQLENIAELADGAIFNIHAYKPSDAMRITQPGYTAIRQCLEGNGVGLILRADGQVEEYQLDSSNRGSQTIELRAGDVDVWIAGENGLKILDRSTPPFQLEFEVPVNLDNPGEVELPEAYSRRYRELVEQAERRELSR